MSRRQWTNLAMIVLFFVLVVAVLTRARRSSDPAAFPTAVGATVLSVPAAYVIRRVTRRSGRD